MPNSVATSSPPRRVMLLTGASRGIGHATVKRFSAAGWRVITCSRHPFPEDCPWDAGPEDHIQVDLSDSADTAAAILRMKEKLREYLPSYMIPKKIIFLNQLPMNQNGKVDRKQLGGLV